MRWLAAVVVALGLGCGVEYGVGVEIQAGSRVAEVKEFAFRVYASDRCPTFEQVALNQETVPSVHRQLFARGEQPQAVGEVSGASHAFALIGRDASCRPVVFGCAVADVRFAKGVVIRAEDVRWPADADPCRAPLSCQEGRCVAVPGCDSTACDGRCCAGECVDTRSDDRHCGGCGDVCPDGCDDGVCPTTLTRECERGCLDGQECCGAACVDTRVDANHCGGCGRPCDGLCAAGDCVSLECPCDGDTHCCRGVCVRGDVECEPDVCDDQDCAVGSACCGGDACVPLMSDSQNCGRCGVECIGAARCSGGLCRPIVPLTEISVAVGPHDGEAGVEGDLALSLAWTSAYAPAASGAEREILGVSVLSLPTDEFVVEVSRRWAPGLNIACPQDCAADGGAGVALGQLFIDNGGEAGFEQLGPGDVYGQLDLLVVYASADIPPGDPVFERPLLEGFRFPHGLLAGTHAYERLDVTMWIPATAVSAELYEVLYCVDLGTIRPGPNYDRACVSAMPNPLELRPAP